MKQNEQPRPATGRELRLLADVVNYHARRQPSDKRAVHRWQSEELKKSLKG